MIKHVSIDDITNYITQPMLGLSGTRAAKARETNEFMAKHEDAFENSKGFVTGGCIGFDHHAGEYLALRYYKAIHVVLVPANRSKVKYWWKDKKWEKYAARIYVVEMPPGSTYRDRNAQIVSITSYLLALAEYPELDERSKRSGTWQTVRMSSRRHRFAPRIGVLDEPEALTA